MMTMKRHVGSLTAIFTKCSINIWSDRLQNIAVKIHVFRCLCDLHENNGDLHNRCSVGSYVLKANILFYIRREQYMLVASMVTMSDALFGGLAVQSALRISVIGLPKKSELIFSYCTIVPIETLRGENRSFTLRE